VGREDPKRSPAVAEDDDLEQGAPARGHRDLGPPGGGDLAGGDWEGRAAEGRETGPERLGEPPRCVAFVLWWELERREEGERKPGPGQMGKV